LLYILTRAKLNKDLNETRQALWLTPVILATQEAEIRRIAVEANPRQIVLKTLSRKKPITKKKINK
jgi:hypothetical protein